MIDRIVASLHVVTLAMVVASHTTRAAPSSTPDAATGQQDAADDERIVFGGLNTMYTMARADCPSVSVLFRGVTVRPERFKDFGLRSVRIRFADGEDLVFRSLQGEVHVWPEVVFSPDCKRVALLRTTRGPYVIVATRTLRDYLKGRHVAARYLHDEVPCGPEFAYQDLRWVSNSEVEYRSGGGGPMVTRRREIEDAPDRYERKRCLDPKSPLYEGEHKATETDLDPR